MNMIKNKTKVRLVGAVASLATTATLATTGVAAPASAAVPHPRSSNGFCAGRVTDYAMNNHRNGAIAVYAKYFWPDVFDPDPATATRVSENALTITPYYFRCTTRADGHGHIIRGHTQFKMFKIMWCWHFVLNEEHTFFGGWKMQARQYDAAHTNVRPGGTHVADKDGQVLRCHMQYVPNKLRHWSDVRDLPLFRAVATMVVNWGLPDHNKIIGAQRLNPREDWRTRGPHW